MKSVVEWLQKVENQNVYDCIVFNVFKSEDDEIYKEHQAKYFSQ